MGWGESAWLGWPAAADQTCAQCQIESGQSKAIVKAKMAVLGLMPLELNLFFEKALTNQAMRESMA